MSTPTYSCQNCQPCGHAPTKLLGNELGRNHRGREQQSTKARRPVAGHRACYACGMRGHIRWDCPYLGGRVPHSEQGRQQIPQAGRWVRKPRRLKICWDCGREGHLQWACPRQRVQVSPGEGTGPRTDPERPTAAKKWGACWRCQRLGHIRRHCPPQGK
uniref:CCHC-type domain-containing protein n=1 Tax=Chrysemys picta bellii TaxID=8478 RepID=A0A8C3IXD2_CHRPI